MAAFNDPSQFLYQSPPGSGGNDGALPQVYDVTWQKFTNLTPQQVLAFQAFPPDLLAYLGLRRWNWETGIVMPLGPFTPYITIPANVANPTINGMQLTTDDRSQSKIGQLKQAADNGAVNVFPFPLIAVNGVYMLSQSDLTAMYGYVVRYVQSTYDAAATLIAQINQGQVTTRAAIDTALATITVK